VKELIIRFLVGGTVVSLFAILGDLFKPKSFAGLFGAAPSIALATLGLTIAKQGRLYAASESCSMILGAIAFFIYASLVSRALMRTRIRALPATGGALVLWLGSALGLWFAILK
jgi:uncharacterized membrane protein (GlpM family)